uniref:Uncharacterized protein n=2 Tax=Lepeophtheirus salmonis TaxID=72036 RepID=A0A0K2U3G8_LEPSM
MILVYCLTFILCSLTACVSSVPHVVQTLSSNYALILGGYGGKYKEILSVEVVKHDKVCGSAISDIPPTKGRFLGDKSGLAETINDEVIFCRHRQCWMLDIYENKWKQISGFSTTRIGAASATVDNKMIILGGKGKNDSELITFEVYDPTIDKWLTKPEWQMSEERYSFCAVPINRTSLVIIGGYRDGHALSSVELLNIETNQWELLPSLPSARYGQSCLLTEFGGHSGILATGGALTGSEVLFFDIEARVWKKLKSLEYKVDGHKMAIVEGIPTMFSWEHIEQFNGVNWVTTDLRLNHSRSAFAVTTIPGHLVRSC